MRLFSFLFFQWSLSSSMKSEQTLMKKINWTLKPNWFSEIYWKKLCRGINTVQMVFALASIQKRKFAAPLFSLCGYKLCDQLWRVFFSLSRGRLLDNNDTESTWWPRTQKAVGCFSIFSHAFCKHMLQSHKWAEIHIFHCIINI